MIPIRVRRKSVRDSRSEIEIIVPAPVQNTVEIAEAIVGFINQEIMASARPIVVEDTFAEAGVDSMALMKILLFIETTYGFWIPDEDLTEDVIADATCMARYIEKRLLSEG